MYPSGAQGSRANLEWRTNSYANLLLRRTLLHVYANAGEIIEIGSTAVAVGSGDAFIYNPGRVTGTVGNETIPATADFQATSQRGRGTITSRTQELAGPQAVSGGGNPSGYKPAYYTAPSTGIYSVVFWGTAGGNSATDGGPTGDVAMASTANFDTTQGTSVSAWDVTVRSSTTSTTDLNGRLFCYYAALFTGGNGRPMYSSLYAITNDGYEYRIDMHGMDGNGFIIEGNPIGLYDSDGTSPLYHDGLGSDGQLTTITGGVTIALPTYPMFLNNPDATTVSNLGIPLVPITPSITGFSFSGVSGGNNTRVSAGGTFQYTSNIAAVYQIIISRDGVNFDPTNPNNRALRGWRAAGTNTVTWDGKDNVGNPFPVGINYQAEAFIHAGEYHFPLLDVENSIQGGPAITMLNATNPLGNTYGFYDDRGYKTVGGTYCTADGTAATYGRVLGGLSPPTTAYANPITGFDTTSAQRAYGSATGGNTNTPNTGSFGDCKALDLWTYLPSSTTTSSFNIQGAPTILLVKRITAVNGTPITGFVDDPGTTNDNSALWPSPSSTYLRGALSATNVKPGDTLEYTIYFLVTNGPATNFLLCDIVPSNMTFVSTSYNGLTPTDGGTPGADSGIALALSTTTLPTAPTNYLTNIADADRGQFYAPGTQAPAAANAASGFTQPLPAAQNTTGVVAVQVVTSPTLLQNATGSGTPVNSYGFIRFQAKVN